MNGLLRDLHNPRIKRIEPELLNKDKTCGQEQNNIQPYQKSESYTANKLKELNNIDNTNYIAKVCLENNTPLIAMKDQKNNPIISTDSSKVAFKCPIGHPHMIDINEVARGVAKCPTCSIGTVFSKKVIFIMRNEFDIILILKDPLQNTKQDIIYHNPLLKIEVICETEGNDRIECDDILKIYIHSKPKQRIVNFLRQVLINNKKISIQFYPLPFGEDSALNYYGNGLIEEGNIIESKIMFFENC